jgi:microcystin-dependent protein
MNPFAHPHGRHLPWIVPPGFGEPPVGTIIAFAGNLGAPLPDTAQPPGLTPPATPHRTDAVEAWGWMLCDGRELKCSDHGPLFAALGRQYGGNEKTGTFRLPDCRGFFLRGADNGAGIDPDAADRTPPNGGTGQAQEAGSLQQDALQKHEHGYRAAGEASGGANGPGAIPGTADSLTDLGPVDALPPARSTVRASSETRPVNLYVHYLIKYTYGLRPL